MGSDDIRAQALFQRRLKVNMARLLADVAQHVQEHGSPEGLGDEETQAALRRIDVALDDPAGLGEFQGRLVGEWRRRRQMRGAGLDLSTFGQWLKWAIEFLATHPAIVKFVLTLLLTFLDTGRKDQQLAARARWAAGQLQSLAMPGVDE